MKRIFTIPGIALTLLLFASLSNTASAQPRRDVNISYQTFYDELDPYGQWMDYPDYGYVWVPDAGMDFRPYETNGHWVWTDDYEWMWVSDYNWGWAPFHYGRWLQDASYGWMWVPGYEWSPAWVAWRDGGDYYGWAPLRPGINISVNFSLGGYNPPVDYWCFAPRRYITSPRIYDYCSPRHNNVTIINQTTIINNYNYNRNVFRTGPGRREAERYTGRINPVRFREASDPGRARFRNNEVSVYRPRVQQDNNRQYTPRRVERFDRNGQQNNRGVARDNGNNLPDRRNREFNNNNERQSQQPGNDNGAGNRRRFERNNDGNNNNERQSQQPGNENGAGNRRRFERNNSATDQPGTAEPRNRGFERPGGNGNAETMPQRNPGQQRGYDPQRTERQPDQNNERRREIYNNRNENNQQPDRREMRSENRQPQAEQRRPEPQPRQFERRQEQPRQQEQSGSQPPSRQFENRGGDHERTSEQENRGGRRQR